MQRERVRTTQHLVWQCLGGVPGAGHLLPPSPPFSHLCAISSALLNADHCCVLSWLQSMLPSFDVITLCMRESGREPDRLGALTDNLRHHPPPCIPAHCSTPAAPPWSPRPPWALSQDAQPGYPVLLASFAGMRADAPRAHATATLCTCTCNAVQSVALQGSGPSWQLASWPWLAHQAAAQLLTAAVTASMLPSQGGHSCG
jgi:hypothetical protein